MRHDSVRIGSHFLCGDRHWRCTDIGTRVIVAIALDHEDDPSWYNGPPYAVAEMVFDENDLEGCEPIEAGELLAVHDRHPGLVPKSTDGQR